MGRLRGWIGLIALGVGATATADVGPPAGKKYVPVRTLIEAAERFDDFVSFQKHDRTYFGSRPGPAGRDEPARWRTDTVIHSMILAPDHQPGFIGGRREDATVYAIPVADFRKFPSEEVAAAAVDRGEVPGAVRLRLDSLAELPIGDPRTEVVTRLRAERTPDGGLMFRQLADPGDVEAAAEARVRWVVAGVAAAIAIAGLGLWLARRRPAPTGA